ncbi:MAG: TetR/AcrR family transcriptional regulator [Candidatus Kapaibacterium sp.]
MSTTNKAELKLKIASTAAGMFSKQGYKQVKTDDIARQCGISKRTLYEVYKSKEAIFTDIVESNFRETTRKLDEIINRIINVDDVDFQKELENILRVSSDNSKRFSKTFFTDIRTYIPHVWEKIVEFREEKYKKNFRVIFKKGQEKGVFRNDINKEIAYLLHYHTVRNIAMPEVINTLPMTATEIIGDIYKILFTGVLTEDARKNYNCKDNNDV